MQITGCHPVTSECRANIEAYVLGAYEAEIAKRGRT